MQVVATLVNQFNQHSASVATNGNEKSISIASKPGGYGSSVNGAELLLLAIATCYCNDIYREARKRGITVTSVSVHCSGEFGADGEPGKNFSYRPEIVSNADAETVRKLLIETDAIAEIHKTLRQGITIQLETAAG